MEAVSWDGRAIIMADEPPRLRGSSESTSEVRASFGDRYLSGATTRCAGTACTQSFIVRVYAGRPVVDPAVGSGIGTWRGVVAVSHVAWPIILLCTWSTWSAVYRVNETLRRAESRGEDPPDVSKRTRWLDPLASIDEAGSFELAWNKELYTKLENLSKKHAPSGPGR